MVPPNAVVGTNEPGIVTVEGRDSFGRKMADYKDMAHICYADLGSTVRVHFPFHHIVASVPATRTGCLARTYAPAVMLHAVIESIIIQFYKSR
jgi:hypothetical protein